MKQGVCRHFKGLLLRNEPCGAGLDVQEVTGGEKLGWLTRTPCLKSNNSAVICDSYSEPTQKEIEESEADMRAAMDRIIKAQPLIAEIKIEHGKTNASGTKVCPVCNNKLHYSVAECNGHVWGKCETDGCLSWME